MYLFHTARASRRLRSVNYDSCRDTITQGSITGTIQKLAAKADKDSHAAESKALAAKACMDSDSAEFRETALELVLANKQWYAVKKLPDDKDELVEEYNKEIEALYTKG
ncbi:hypothetical protein N7478_006805 [Penicillium angulare]|uniref:uncharacterized protein n=1 Tax=Penicillium angulare TaxID=116970 RepID=UPI00253F6B9F|nr:uncharacterized protein N7478_006805 [Penicillium angulare]KAJ5281433.1 hypothetical protein N7478_006805 [Penicillium angulare]